MSKNYQVPFDPNEQYGYYMESTDVIDDAVFDEIKRVLMERKIEPFIPEQYRHRIVWTVQEPDEDLGWTLTWKYIPEVKK